MVLVDTSVWIDHLRRDNRRLRALLDDGLVIGHPFIYGELACGDLRNRRQTLDLLQALPTALPVSHTEALFLLENERLQGRGLGWIDVHLLASARLTGCRLWTFDKPLASAAVSVKVEVEH